MLKVRVIPTLLYKDHGLVKGVGFNSWRRVGTAMPAIKVYNTRQVDELILVDIAATPEKRTIDFEEIDRLADDCFMPLTVGGGIRSSEDVRKLLRAGADKVAVNSAVIENPGLITELSDKFGSQCVVVSIDARKIGGKYEVFSQSGTCPTGLEVVAWAHQAEKAGAGEILLTSIERDGTMQGYDLDLIRSVSEAVSIPVIASGGAGKADDLAEAVLTGKAAAVAAASIFHFTEETPLGVKRHLKSRGINVRI